VYKEPVIYEFQSGGPQNNWNYKINCVTEVIRAFQKKKVTGTIAWLFIL
jgi:hypothetical protein